MTKYQKSLNTQMAGLLAILQSDWGARCHGLPHMTPAERAAVEAKYDTLLTRFQATYRKGA